MPEIGQEGKFWVWFGLVMLTLSGRKVFQILAFFLILIFQKTHLNIQNPTARTPPDR